MVKALAESPWGIFTVGATIPIALLMGCYMRFVRIGKILEASTFGVTLLLLVFTVIVLAVSTTMIAGALE